MSRIQRLLPNQAGAGATGKLLECTEHNLDQRCLTSDVRQDKNRATMRVSRQLGFDFGRSWGGVRPGAGRKRTRVGRPCLRHVARPTHHRDHPVLVTMRARVAFRCLRSVPVFPAVRDALTNSLKEAFRILQFSVQQDHVHLLVEAGSTEDLSRGMQGLAIRLAKAVNRALDRRGPVWDDRFHARALRTPREVRSALVYVLMNHRKHDRSGPDDSRLDECSSAPWFDGWRDATKSEETGQRPVSRPQTWLASVGWRRAGLIRRDETPRVKRARHLASPAAAPR